MLSLGVPVADAAVSADIPEDKAESYVRGTKVVPVDAVNLDFEAVALMGDYDDVLTEDDVVAVLSKKSHLGPPGGLPQGPGARCGRGGGGAARIPRHRGGGQGLPRRGLPRMRRRLRAPRPRGRREAPGLGRGGGRHLLLRRRVPRLPAHAGGGRGDGGLPGAQGDARRHGAAASRSSPSPSTRSSRPRASRSCASGRTRPSRPATSASPTTPGRASRSRAARRSTSSS